MKSQSEVVSATVGGIGDVGENIGQNIGITPLYVNRIVKIKEQIINMAFPAIMEAFAYNVRLEYEKREG